GKYGPSGLNQTPDGSITSGQRGRGSRQAITNTQRRRARTGRSTPAMAATAAAHGPAAFTAISHASVEPSASATASTRDPARRRPVTSCGTSPAEGAEDPDDLPLKVDERLFY